MANLEEIKAVLEAEGLDLIGDPVSDPNADNRTFVFINVEVNSAGQRTPSNHKLSRLAKQLEYQIGEIIFVVGERDQEDVLATLKSAIARNYPDDVRNIFISFAENEPTVWLEPKRNLSEKNRDLIKEKVIETFKVLNIERGIVRFTSTANIPTRTAILREIRLAAPVDACQLQRSLAQRGFDIPSESWLMRELDKARRSGFTLRRRDKRYILTLLGLTSLGSSKSGQSPDVRRALAIGKWHN